MMINPPTPSNDGVHRLWEYPPEGSPPIGPPRGGPDSCVILPKTMHIPGFRGFPGFRGRRFPPLPRGTNVCFLLILQYHPRENAFGESFSNVAKHCFTNVFLTFWGGLGAVRRAPASPPNLANDAKARGGGVLLVLPLPPC